MCMNIITQIRFTGVGYTSAFPNEELYRCSIVLSSMDDCSTDYETGLSHGLRFNRVRKT